MIKKIEIHQLRHANGTSTCKISEHKKWILFELHSPEYDDDHGENRELDEWMMTLFDIYRDDRRRKALVDLITGDYHEVVWEPDKA